MKLFFKKYMGVFCGDLLNIGCSEFKRAWKIWQPSIVVFWRLSRQLKCTHEQNYTEMTSYDISSLSASVETGVICSNAALQRWLDNHNLVVFSLNYTSNLTRSELAVIWKRQLFWQPLDQTQCLKYFHSCFSYTISTQMRIKL